MNIIIAAIILAAAAAIAVFINAVMSAPDAGQNEEQGFSSNPRVAEQFLPKTQPQPQLAASASQS